MGLLDLFGKKDKEPKAAGKREMTRLARLASEKLAQNYDRQDAIARLGELKTPDAVTAIFRRFDWVMDPSITDQEEKQIAADCIAAAGEVALEPLHRYCKKADSLTWPLRILERVIAKERIHGELLLLLDQFDSEYMRNPEPKIQLLDCLAEYPGEETRVAIEPFLDDMSEPVRFTSVGSVLAMGSEASVVSLVAQLAEEESLRVRNRIARGLVERGWVVPEEQRDTCETGLPDGFRLVDGRVVVV